MTLGKPCDWRMLRNSNVSISNPNEPSIMSRTRSAIFPTSIMLLRSLLHSMNVRRRFLPVTTVMGPLASFSVCLVYRLTRLLSRVVLPTPGGPTMATMTGGGSSSGVRLTRGTWRRVWSFSAVRRPCLSARRPDFGAKAFSLKPCCFSLPFADGLCGLCGRSSMAAGQLGRLTQNSGARNFGFVILTPNLKLGSTQALVGRLS